MVDGGAEKMEGWRGRGGIGRWMERRGKLYNISTCICCKILREARDLQSDDE
jgi:hypothetical protein